MNEVMSEVMIGNKDWMLSYCATRAALPLYTSIIEVRLFILAICAVIKLLSEKDHNL